MAEELDWLTETGGDTLDGLASLLDKSLIRKVDPDDAASRVMMLETIREYAAERLDELPEFAAAARQAHAALLRRLRQAAMAGPHRPAARGRPGGHDR